MSIVATKSVEITDTQAVDEFIPNAVGAQENIGDLEPVGNPQVAVLEAIGVSDSLDNLPDVDKNNLADASNYIEGIMEQRGLPRTRGGYNKAISHLKEVLDIDAEAEPSFVLSKLGGIVRAWKGLSFVRDASEKRSIFMKMARMKSSEEMEDFLLKTMENKSVWQ